MTGVSLAKRFEKISGTTLEEGGEIRTRVDYIDALLKEISSEVKRGKIEFPNSFLFYAGGTEIFLSKDGSIKRRITLRDDRGYILDTCIPIFPIDVFRQPDYNQFKDITITGLESILINRSYKQV